MSELKVRLYQASFNSSHPAGGTTKIILLNYISVPLLNGIKPLRTTEIIARQVNRMDAMSRIETERSFLCLKSIGAPKVRSLLAMEKE